MQDREKRKSKKNTFERLVAAVKPSIPNQKGNECTGMIQTQIVFSTLQ